MEIKVITRHCPSNYGSVLQSIATIEVLKRMGHKASIIDYQCPEERGIAMIKEELWHKKDYNNPIKKLLYFAIRYPVEKYAQIRFDQMRKKYLTMTQRYTYHYELEGLESDVFMTGSDQVWGPIAYDKYDSAYFLDFAPRDSRKIAYAGSFGRIQFDRLTLNAFKRLFENYDAISVREKTAEDILKSWDNVNYVGRVLDPTLLLSAADWMRIVELSNCIPPKGYEKYILVYQIHNDSNLWTYVRGLASHLNLRIINVNAFAHKIKRGSKFYCCPGLDVFLSLIKNALYIVTDSFHGTCFSINLNKQFMEILPNNSTGTRNQSILELTGLSDRIVRDYSDFSLADRSIDYNRINEILRIERERSIDILKSMLSMESHLEMKNRNIAAI